MTTSTRQANKRACVPHVILNDAICSDGFALLKFTFKKTFTTKTLSVHVFSRNLKLGL